MEKIGVKIFAIDNISGILGKIAQKENTILQKTGQVADGFKQVGASAKSAEGAIQGINQKVGFLANAVKGLVAGAVVGGAINAVRNLGESVVQTQIQMSALENAIKFSGGEEGQKNLDFLKQTVEKYGLPLKESAEGFKTLSGAMMGTNLAGEPMRKIFESVSQNAVVMGLNAEDTKGVFLALGQMMSKGKVSAEELNGQLGERLPGALGIAAEAMGTTKSELLNMMQQGKLMSEDFLPKFAAQLSKTYGGEAIKKTDTLQANLNRLNNRWVEFKSAIGGALAPLLNAVLKKLMSVMEAIKPLADQVQGLFEGIRFPDINPMPALKALLSSVKSTVNAVFGLFKAMYSAIYYPLFEKIAVSVFSVLPDVRGLFADILTAIQPVAKFLREILSSIAQSVDLSGILKTSFEIVRNVVQSLTNVFKVLLETLGPFIKPIVSDAFKMLGNSIKVVLGIVKELSGWFKAITDRIQQATSWVKKKLGLDKGVKEKTEEGTPAEIMLAKPEQATTVKTAEDVFSGESNKNTLSAKNQSTKEIENSTKEIISGGSKPTHITVNIGKFQDYIQITTNNLNQATQDIERQLEEMLLRVVNGVNQVAK